MKYRIQRIPGGYRATILVPVQTRKGKTIMRFTGTARFAEQKKAMKKAIASGAYGEVGFLNFKKIGRSLKKMTKSSAFRNTLRKVKNTLKHPALQATVMAVNPALGTGLITATQAMDQADKLLRVATKGKGKKRIMARAAIKIARAQAPQAPKQLMPAMSTAMMNPAVQQRMMAMFQAMFGGMPMAAMKA